MSELKASPKIGGGPTHVPEAGHGAPDSVADEEIVPVGEPFVLEPKPVLPEVEAKRGGGKDAGEVPEEASQSPFSVTVGLVYDGPLDLSTGFDT